MTVHLDRPSLALLLLLAHGGFVLGNLSHALTAYGVPVWASGVVCGVVLTVGASAVRARETRRIRESIEVRIRKAGA